MKAISFVLFLALAGCAGARSEEARAVNNSPEILDSFAESLSAAAISLTQDKVVYDPSYYSIDYPGGDVPEGVGVCTDVVIRAYRKLGIDLQLLVHEDMKADFEAYPKNWGLTRTDSNIDHRRVPNLRTFFKRQAASLAVTEEAEDYLPGDLVTWMLPGNLPHIGVVVDRKNGTTPMIVHNIGAGQVLQDCLFDYDITGHYRYRPNMPVRQ